MNRSYSIVAAKGISLGDFAAKLGLNTNYSDTREMGDLVQGDESIDTLYAIGHQNDFVFALYPGLVVDSEPFSGLLAKGRLIGLFQSDFDAGSASVSLFEGSDPQSKWVVQDGELVEDTSQRFGNASAETLYFEDLDIEPWNDLYQFIEEPPDEVEMLIVPQPASA
ncbi:MAG: hypothetical protein P1U82_06960 [Verrucomicrobiales bacterium]|jgi:hypothetical protein|nr:hypothetical protein [Verrucomicrobiales bacterium]MDB2347720.1 hypothetical protein [Verrucomicrobiales bacterium]MDF1785594.1 hypothetical protein [Verrucomicrobiales bacterium]